MKNTSYITEENRKVWARFLSLHAAREKHIINLAMMEQKQLDKINLSNNEQHKIQFTERDRDLLNASKSALAIIDTDLYETEHKLEISKIPYNQN